MSNNNSDPDEYNPDEPAFTVTRKDDDPDEYDSERSSRPVVDDKNNNPRVKKSIPKPKKPVIDQDMDEYDPNSEGTTVSAIETNPNGNTNEYDPDPRFQPVRPPRNKRSSKPVSPSQPDDDPDEYNPDS